MTDRVQSVEFSREERRPPVLLAGLLAAAAIIVMALATDGHWAAGVFALTVSLAFALFRKSPDSNELNVPLPAALTQRGKHR